MKKTIIAIAPIADIILGVFAQKNNTSRNNQKREYCMRTCKLRTFLAILVIFSIAFIGCPTPEVSIVDIPTATPAGGAVADNTQITLVTATAGAVIYYTQDGTDPSTASTQYNDSNKPVITTDKLTLKAIAVKTGMSNSQILEAVYTVDFVSDFKVWVDIEDGNQNIGFQSLDAVFDWINDNAIDNGKYIVRLEENSKIVNRNLYYDNKSVSITLKSNDETAKQISGIRLHELFKVSKGVTLILDRGIVLKNSDIHINDWGDAIVSVKGRLIMKTGSVITKEKADGWGWMGVEVESIGEFIMEGGIISGNNILGSLGVSVFGNFIMNNGVISNGIEATMVSGGGVRVYPGANFTMNGGTISNNNVVEGGGVYVGGNFTMNGGTISNNKAGNGGGVFVAVGFAPIWNGVFTMNGGTISGNTADRGAGVFVFYSTFIKTGGTIHGNDDTANANISSVVNKGNAVFACSVSNYAVGKRMENTVGPEVNLMYDYKYGSTNSEGEWEY